MKDYEVTEETIRIVRHKMDGTSSGADVGKMWAHVKHAFNEARGQASNAPIGDSDLYFEPHDEKIVIAFEVSREVTRGE